MERLIKAWQNSVRAFRKLSVSETAFQQELGLLVVAIPAAWFLSTSWRGYWLLIGAVLLLIMVEVLNTGIEAACDAVSREFHIDIQLAKDCGSLAVLISVLIAMIVWGLAIVETISGVPLLAGGLISGCPHQRLDPAQLRREFCHVVAHADDLAVPQLVELLVQGHDLDLGLEVDLVVMRGVESVALALPVLRHHDDRRLQGGNHRQDKVEEDERVGVEALAAEQPDVAQRPNESGRR